MKNIILLLFILTGVLSIKAQESKTETPHAQQAESKSSEFKQQATILKLSLLSPYFGVEQKLSETISVFGRIGPGVSFPKVVRNNGTSRELIFSPYVDIEPRFFLGMEKRAAKGKRIDYFSGFYIGVPFTKNLSNPGYYIGCLPGFQRAFRKKGFFHISLGTTYEVVEREGKFWLAVDFGLGFILN